VLASMNDLTRMYEIHIDVNGGLEHCDLDEITKKVNRTPRKNLDWSYSIDILENYLS
jgi:IS30 family transposase